MLLLKKREKHILKKAVVKIIMNMMKNMSPEQLSEIQKMAENMSPEERDDMMKKAKDLM